jgi:hypothetical protein
VETPLQVDEESPRLKLLFKLLLKMFNFNVLIFERKEEDGFSGGKWESGRKRLKTSRILRLW